MSDSIIGRRVYSPSQGWEGVVRSCQLYGQAFYVLVEFSSGRLCSVNVDYVRVRPEVRK